MPNTPNNRREWFRVSNPLMLDYEVLSEAEIASYGASNLADLVGQLAVRTRSGGGRGGGQPVTLLGGRRISGFGEIRNLPAEAISRIEIFPPEVALSYGYGADQRVINVVLKDNFSAITTELEAGGATDGGRSLFDTQASLISNTENNMSDFFIYRCLKIKYIMYFIISILRAFD